MAVTLCVLTGASIPVPLHVVGVAERIHVDHSHSVPKMDMGCVMKCRRSTVPVS